MNTTSGREEEARNSVEPYDGTTTWMGHTLTHEAIYQMRKAGVNPWLTVALGHEVPLALGDPRHG